MHQRSITSSTLEKERAKAGKLAELDKLPERHAKLAKIKKISEESLSTSQPWYFVIWSYGASMAKSIQDKFTNPIIDYLFPNNPNRVSLLDFIGFSKWSPYLGILSPIALALSWKKFWNDCKKDVENRNFWHYWRRSELVFGLILNLGWTFLYGISALCLISSITAATTLVFAAVSSVVPYIAAAAFGLFALYGLVNGIKHLNDAKHAAKAGDKTQAEAFYWKAAKSIFGVILNVFALTANVILGIQMLNAADKIDMTDIDKSKPAVDEMTSLFEKGSKILNVLTSFYIVAAVVKIGSHIRAWYLEKYKTPQVKIPSNPTPEIAQKTAEQDEDLAKSPRPSTTDALRVLSAKIENKIQNYEKQSQSLSDKNLAKYHHLAFLLAYVQHSISPNSVEKPKYDTIEKIEARSKMISRELYTSFFKDVGEVKQLTLEAEKLTTSDRAKPAA